MPTLYATSSTLSISSDGITWTPIATLDAAISLDSLEPIGDQPKSFRVIAPAKIKFKLHMTRKQRIQLFKLVGVPHGLRRASRRAQKRDARKHHRM